MTCGQCAATIGGTEDCATYCEVWECGKQVIIYCNHFYNCIPAVEFLLQMELVVPENNYLQQYYSKMYALMHLDPVNVE